MNKLLVLAALSMAAAPAMASKARLSSLGNAAQLIDTQTIFVNPADLEYTGDWATLEFGASGSASNPTYTGGGAGVAPTMTGPAATAEGGVSHTFSWGKMGVYLGHRDDSAALLVQTANMAGVAGGAFTAATVPLLEEQNPLDVFYGNDAGAMKWGVGVHYANSKSDVNDAKVHTAGISGGLRTDVWDVALRVGLDGKSEATTGGATSTVKSDGLYKINAGYWLDTWYVYANYYNVAAKINIAGTGDNKVSDTQYQIGANNNHKVDGGNFFYGISYLSTEGKYDNVSKVDASGLPVIVGMEIDAASWMTLRGSVTQSVFYQENKTAPAGAATVKNDMLDNTTVAAGVGIKFNKFVVDASVAAASSTTGAIATDGNNFLTNASVTYMF